MNVVLSGEFSYRWKITAETGENGENVDEMQRVSGKICAI